jgi:hypothetical protein
MKRVLLIVILVLTACSSPVVVKDTRTGLKFPKVVGEDLNQKQKVLPDDYLGKPTLVLVGYLQKAQFDIDRWILGVLQADVPVQIVEVPTIKGMMPEMVQGFINNGMRRGIPKEDWAAVVTVYEDAEKIVNFLGNDRPQSAYAVLLNSQGEVIWTSNRGYSAGQVLDLKSLVEGLSSAKD